MRRPHPFQITQQSVRCGDDAQHIRRRRAVDDDQIPVLLPGELGDLGQREQFLHPGQPGELGRVQGAEVDAVIVIGPRQHPRHIPEPILQQGKGIDLDDIESGRDGDHPGHRAGIVREAETQCVAERMGLIDRGDQHPLPGLYRRDGRRAGQCRLTDSALADEQFEPGRDGCPAVRGPGQPSTRFLSSLRAVSVITFSALRLNIPIIGMVRSTVSSYTTWVVPSGWSMSS